MQDIETLTTERPGRVAQVIPMEPVLLLHRRRLMLCALLLPLYTANLFLVENTSLADHSLFDSAALIFLVFTVFSLFTRPRWSVLNKRRQQAARYNLVVGKLEQPPAQAQADLPALPEIFTIATRPRWSSIMLRTICLSLLSGAGAALISVYAQDQFQTTHYGTPLALAILEIVLNGLTLLIPASYLYALLILSPRQQLSATRDGLTCRRGLRISHIPWQQVRLFAIISQDILEHGPAFYELASEHVLIRWPSRTNSAWRTRETPAAVLLAPGGLAQPISATTFPQQIQFLNIIIAERTGLPLYDLR